MQCKQCGSVLPADAQVCAKCGGRVSASVPAPGVELGGGADLHQMYEAVIGPRKADYYVPIFERFDNGSSAMRWNWAAALVTQLWMLYRGMLLWGFLGYPFLRQLGFALAGLLLSVPLVGALGPAAKGTVYLLTGVAYFMVPGLFGNKLYHRHVRKMIEKSGRLGLSPDKRREWLIRKGAGSGVFVVVVVVVAVAIMGILAAIAIPAYQDYVTRAKVALALKQAKSVEHSYFSFVAQNKQWPSSMKDLGLPEVDARYGAGVGSITIGAEHQLRIAFSDPGIVGKTILLVPSIENGSLVWTCKLGTLPVHDAPLQCRNP